MLKKISKLYLFILLIVISAIITLLFKYNYTWQGNNLRFMDYPFRIHRLVLSGALFSAPSRQGLDDLQVSGSANVDQSVLNNIEKEVKSRNSQISNIIILNITDEEESGNYYYKGIPITKFLYHKTSDGNIITPIENQSLFKRVRSYLYHLVYGFDKHLITSSQELVENNGFKFVRCQARRHHSLSSENYQCLIDVIKNVTKNDWIHVHCAAGHSRTTTFLVMYDIMQNANTVSLEDIVKRQYLLGGENMFITPKDTGSWNPVQIQKRKENIELFYQYVKSHSDTDKFDSINWMK